MVELPMVIGTESNKIAGGIDLRNGRVVRKIVHCSNMTNLEVSVVATDCTAKWPAGLNVRFPRQFTKAAMFLIAPFPGQFPERHFAPVNDLRIAFQA